jgi:hypothetical protein
MAERVRHLGEDIASDMGQTPSGRHLIQDTQELAQSVEDFHETLHDRPDPFRIRQAYAGIDGSWHHLKSILMQPGNATPGVSRAAARVDQLDAQIHQALGLKTLPPAYYRNNAAAPTGLVETQRLAHAMVDRANALAAAIQYEMGRDPNGAALARSAAQLAQAADAFHDSLDANPDPQAIGPAFAPVDALADQLERVLTGNGIPPRVRGAWQSFASVEVLLHQNLNLDSPQPDVPINLAAPGGGGPSPLAGLAEQLVEQSAALLQVFGPNAGRVPEGGYMLADAERLQAAAADFRQDVRRGLAPNQLAFEFRDVDATWQRLARRVDRIARGRTGPNIQQVQKLGAICEGIHQALGMPGYPPVLGPYDAPPGGVPGVDR